MVMQNGPWWNPGMDTSGLPSPSVPDWLKNAPSTLLGFLRRGTMGPGLPSYQTVGSAISALPSTIGALGGGGSQMLAGPPAVTNLEEAKAIIAQVISPKFADQILAEVANGQRPAEGVIQYASTLLNAPDRATQQNAQTALQTVRKPGVVPVSSALEALGTKPTSVSSYKAPPGPAGIAGMTSAVAPGDVMGALNQAATPSAGVSAVTSSDPRIAALERRKQTALDTMNYLKGLMAQDPSLASNYQGDYNKALADYNDADYTIAELQVKTSGAGGISADTAANIASQREARAQAQAQFEAQMQFDRQQAIQRIREAQTATMERITALRQSATQQGNQFIAENARWASPAGSQYAPGREPGSLLAQAVQKAGYNFTPVERPTVAVDPYAASKQIETDVQELLQQMKGWGIGE